MLADSVIQELLSSLEGDAKAAQPLVLSSQNIAAFDLEDVRIVRCHEKCADEKQTEIEVLREAGFEILAVLVMRNDDINYGSGGCVAVCHRLMTVMVKRKKE